MRLGILSILAVAGALMSVAPHPSQAAPAAGALAQQAPIAGSGISKIYYYRGHYYPYRYRGHYYPYQYRGRYYSHRAMRGGRWYYY
jgi:hypothetical protein